MKVLGAALMRPMPERMPELLHAIAIGDLGGFVGVCDRHAFERATGNWLRKCCYAMPVAGGIIGFVTGGEKWREAALPAQKAAELRPAEPQH